MLRCIARLRFHVLAPIVIIVLVLIGCGGSNSASSPANVTSLGVVLDSLVQGEMLQSGFPGMTVALAKRGTILYSHGYGVTDLSTRNPSQPTTVFEIGSITKQFTSSLIMKLEETGQLHVDDSAATYLPAYGFSPAVTLRTLLTHTSGLADFTNFPDFGQWVTQGVSEPTALMEISQGGLQFQPGTQYAYSNSNYFLLGAIIEAVTGMSYAENVQQRIFQPLGLQNTYYVLPPANLAATGYANGGAGLVPATTWNRSAAFAAGALSSNVDDLVTWDNALISGEVVSPPSFQQMTTSNGFYQNGYSYGFGVALSAYNNRQLMWHAGQIGGFYTENVVFLDNGFTVIVLTNDQDYDTDPFIFKILNAVCNSSQLASNC